MRYAIARFRERAEQKAYRIYITEALHAMSNGLALTAHFKDIVYKENRPEKELSGPEIIKHMKESIGKVGEEYGV